MVSALGASWGSLGTFLAHLVGLWVALGASLGASWDLLGLLGRLLVPLGVCLGPCWGLLVALGASLGVSRDLLDLLGCLLVGLFVTLLEISWWLLAPPWEFLGTCLAHLLGLLGDWGWRCISLWGRLVQAGYTFGCTRLGLGDWGWGCISLWGRLGRPVTLLLSMCVHRHIFFF